MWGNSVKTYLVGGAVRDSLLDLPVIEHDWVVVGATPEEMLKQGFRRADPDFPVFHHPETGEEYALARKEVKIGMGYRGFVVDANPAITLEQDLTRRDLTVNAIAQDKNGNLVDPCNGQEDLRDGYLRHASPAFPEDPVRLLRIARFAAKLGHCGFRVAHKTHKLMQKMVADRAVAELEPARIWQEMKKSLVYPQPWRFFEVLDACGALEGLFPALAANPPDDRAHQSNLALDALRQACKLSDRATVRFAALFLAVDIPDWLDTVVEKRFNQLLSKAKKAWLALACLIAKDAAGIHHFLQQNRAWHDSGHFFEIMQVLQAQSRYPGLLADIFYAQQICTQINSNDIKSQGITGAALGQAITQRKIQLIQNYVID